MCPNAKRRRWLVVIGAIASYQCGPLAGISEKPCRPGCVDEKTRLVCDARGAHAESCREFSEPCASAVCREGSCVARPAVGTSCGSSGLARCNDGYACIGPDV